MIPAQKGAAGAAVASANNVTNPTTLTPALPAHAVDDLLLCYTACRSATPTVACAGWTQLANVAGTNGRIALFGKIATSSSETAPSVVWSGMTTGTSGTPAQAQCAVFTGAQLSVGALGTIENGAASATVSASGTGITTVADNALVLALSSRLDDVGTWTPPSGFTEIGEALTTSGADMSFSWAYQIKATPGAVAPADFAIASGVSFASTGLLVAIRSIVPVTYFGVTSLAATFGRVINGVRKTFSSLALPISFDSTVSGEVSTPTVTHYGVVSSSLIFDSTTVGQRQTFGQFAAPFVFSKDVSGQRKTFGQTAFPITIGIATAGFRPGVTLYGVVSLPITFSKDVLGRRKAFGQIAMPLAFAKDVAGRRQTFGQTNSPLLFSKDVRAQRKTFGQTAFPISASIAVAGFKSGSTFYGQTAFPIAFVKDVKGIRKVFGQTAFPIAFVKDVKGVRKTFGQIVFPIIFTKEALGRRNAFGQLSMQTLFGKEVAAQRKTFGQSAFPLAFGKEVVGRRKTFGQVALPINAPIVVSGYGWVGPKTYYGQTAMALRWTTADIQHPTAGVAGVRKTFGQVTAPFLLGSVSQGKRRTFSKLALPFDFGIAVKSGRIGIHGRIAFPIVIGFNTAGKIIVAGITLNDATNLYLGEQDVVAAYIGGELVWLPPRSS